MLVETLIAQICADLVGQQLQACHKALEAAGLQTNATQQINFVEDGTRNYATDKATSAVRQIGVEKEVGAVLYVVRLARDRHVEYRIIRNNGLIPEVRTGAGGEGETRGTLQLHWNF